MRRSLSVSVLMFVLAALASSAVAQQAAPDVEPPTLDALRAAPLAWMTGSIAALRLADGTTLPERRYRIELPALFHPRDLEGPFSTMRAFEIDFGAPRFDVTRVESARALDRSEIGFDVRVERGERPGIAWGARIATMTQRELRGRRGTMRPLPRGERTWIQIELETVRTLSDGTTLRCGADLVPFGRSRHGSIEAAVGWMVDRCASVELDPSPAR